MESRNVIFLSYSRADADVRDRFVKHLRSALLDGSGLELFVDTEIEAGEEWREAIEAALDSAVLGIFLLSADLVTSKFINEREIPKLVGARARGEADVGVLFVHATHTEGAALRVERPDGGKVTIKLDDYQALATENRPNRPLSLLGEGEREVVLKEAAGKAVELALARLRALPPDDPRTSSLRLDIDILRDANGPGSSVAYSSQGCSLFRAHFDEPLREDDPGTRLFRTLFPDAGSAGQTWKRIARELGAPDRTPAGLPLQVVVTTDQPELCAEPWSQLHDRGKSLRDLRWTVSFRSETAAAARDATLRLRLPFLVWVGGTDRSLNSARHLHALRSRLQEVLGNSKFVHSATRRDAGIAAATRYSPGVLYCHAPVAERRDGTLALRFADGDVSAAEILQAGGDNQPRVIHANLFGATRAQAARFGWELRQQVPWVVVRACSVADLDPNGARTWASSQDPQDVALASLVTLAEGGHFGDPHEVLPPGSREEIVFWSAGELQFTSRHQTLRGERRIARHFLDRHTQREAVQGTLTELSRSQRRVSALFGVAGSGNLLEALGEQVGQYLFERSGDLPMQRIDIDLTRCKELDRTILLEEICEQLGGDPEDVEGTLRAACVHPGRAQLLLDLGVRGAPRELPFGPSQLKEVLRCLAKDLTPHVPREMLLQVLLCVESSGDTKPFEHDVRDLAADLVGDLFQVRVLPPLANVPIDDLSQYLHDHGGLSQRLFDRRKDVARWLLSQTDNGRFEHLVRLIDRQQEHGWADAESAPELDPAVAGDEPAGTEASY